MSMQNDLSSQNLNGDHKPLTDQIADQSHAAVERAQQLGNDALDGVDHWLEPLGLSLRRQPWLALAVLGTAAVGVGALCMSRRNRTVNEQVTARLNDLMQRARRW